MVDWIALSDKAAFTHISYKFYISRFHSCVTIYLQYYLILPKAVILELNSTTKRHQRC